MKSNESKVVITIGDSKRFTVDINDMYEIISMARYRAESLNVLSYDSKSIHLKNCIHICSDLCSAFARVEGGNV